VFSASLKTGALKDLLFAKFLAFEVFSDAENTKKRRGRGGLVYCDKDFGERVQAFGHMPDCSSLRKIMDSEF